MIFKLLKAYLILVTTVATIMGIIDKDRNMRLIVAAYFIPLLIILIRLF